MLTRESLSISLPKVICTMQTLLGATRLRLVRWVLATNRSYITPLAAHERFSQLDDCLYALSSHSAVCSQQQQLCRVMSILAPAHAWQRKCLTLPGLSAYNPIYCALQAPGCILLMNSATPGHVTLT